MGLTIVQDLTDPEVRAYPKVFCDWCSEEITDAADGNFEWVMERDGRLQARCDVYFTHKRCSEAWGASMGHLTDGLFIGNMELAIFPVQLAGNLQLDWARARVKAYWAAGIGNGGI
jgi:hypothetical protein